jgi:hypothetical protein
MENLISSKKKVSTSEQVQHVEECEVYSKKRGDHDVTMFEEHEYNPPMEWDFHCAQGPDELSMKLGPRP